MTMTVSEDIRLARVYLMRVAEPPAPALHALVDALGPVAAADAVRTGDAPEKVLDETSARRHLNVAADDLVAAEKAGARLLVPEDEDWPAWQLLCLSAATDRGLRWAGSPLGMWVRGSAPVAEVFDQAISVVGARAATAYGEHIAAQVGYTLADAGMTVVSGAAMGIDGAAHRGALAADGVTVAVLACGIDIAYPATHTTLLDRITERGLLLSEYPPGTTPARHRTIDRTKERHAEVVDVLD